jgi:nicotinamide-nucleotide amidase
VLTDGANPSVATYAKRDGVHVRVAAKADSPEAAKAIANDVEGQVRTLLLDTLWGEDTDELAAVILKTLQAKNKTLATMESLTGGLLGDFITSVPGASTIYEGGVVAYTLKQKAAFGVSEAILEAHGAVSAETAREMARAAATRFESDYGLATTGVAGPDNAEGKPVGEIYLAVFDAQTGQETVKRVQFPPLERNWVRERAAFAALSLLFSTLNG